MAVAAHGAAEEIGLESALGLVREGRSVFVWIGGKTDVALAALLKLEGRSVVDAQPKDLLDKGTCPEALKRYDRPILVCHHGVSSYRVAAELSGRLGIRAYSLSGGIEGIKKSVQGRK